MLFTNKSVASFNHKLAMISLRNSIVSFTPITHLKESVVPCPDRSTVSELMGYLERTYSRLSFDHLVVGTFTGVGIIPIVQITIVSLTNLMLRSTCLE